VNHVPKTSKKLPKKTKIVLTEKNTVVFDTAVGKKSVIDISFKLSKLVAERSKAKKSYPIYLVMDSPGGSVMSGLKFIEFARHFKNVHTITIYAASMAAYIVQAMPGKRYILGTGNMMFHRASISGFGGQIVFGEFESRYKHIKKMVTQSEKTNADRIGISLEQYRKKVKDEWWLWGAEAVLRKTADEVPDVLCSQELVLKKEEKTVIRGFRKHTYLKSACPTI